MLGRRLTRCPAAPVQLAALVTDAAPAEDEEKVAAKAVKAERSALSAVGAGKSPEDNAELLTARCLNWAAQNARQTRVLEQKTLLLEQATARRNELAASLDAAVAARGKMERLARELQQVNKRLIDEAAAERDLHAANTAAFKAKTDDILARITSDSEWEQKCGGGAVAAAAPRPRSLFPIRPSFPPQVRGPAHAVSRLSGTAADARRRCDAAARGARDRGGARAQADGAAGARRAAGDAVEGGGAPPPAPGQRQGDGAAAAGASRTRPAAG